jgi:hypothetical protein
MLKVLQLFHVIDVMEQIFWYFPCSMSEVMDFVYHSLLVSA